MILGPQHSSIRLNGQFQSCPALDMQHTEFWLTNLKVQDLTTKFENFGLSSSLLTMFSL